MIKQQDFAGIIEDGVWEDTNYTSKICYELATQLAMDFVQWINEHRLEYTISRVKGYWVSSDMKVLSNEQLFYHYTKSQK